MFLRVNFKHIATALVLAAALASCGVSGGKSLNRTAGSGLLADTLDAFHNYVEGIKALYIYDDSLRSMEFFSRAAESDSLFAPAYYELANITVQSDPNLALEYGKRAMELDTVTMDYRAQNARLLLLTGEYDDALRMYRRLITDDPKNPMNYWMLAALYDYREQPFSAITILDSAEYKLGRIEQLTAYKRELMVRVKLYDKAIQETKSMIAESPYAIENYVILGDIYAEMGKDSLALASYNEACRLDPDNPAAALSIAGFYYSRQDAPNYLRALVKLFESDNYPLEHKLKLLEEITGNTDLYRSNYMLVHQLVTTLSIKYPTEYKVLDQYVIHLLRSGEMDAALNLLKGWVESHPDQLEAYNSIFDIESYLMRPDSVYKYVDMAISRFPDKMELYLSKGFALHQMKLYAEALESYKKAYDLSPDKEQRSTVAGIIGDLYYEQGDRKQSYKYYRKALKINPDNFLVLNNYAYYLSEDGKELNKALEMSRRANELSPSNPTFLDTEGWILYLLGDYKTAKERMQQAVALDSNNSAVLLMHYGDILYKLGDHFLAKTYWRKALERGMSQEEYEARMKLPEPPKDNQRQ